MIDNSSCKPEISSLVFMSVRRKNRRQPNLPKETGDRRVRALERP
jgi:hypothetical protein